MAKVPKSALREIHIDIDSHNQATRGRGRAVNPAKRKGTAAPRRVSQVTKKKPSTRLVKRREANTKKGYFPNPSFGKSYPDKNLQSVRTYFEKALRKVIDQPKDELTQAYLSHAQGIADTVYHLRLINKTEHGVWMRELREAANIRMKGL